MKITIYSKAMLRLGFLSDPTSVKVTPRHMALSTATITLPSSHPKLPLLTAEGARVVIEDAGRLLLSGPVRGLTGASSALDGEVSLAVEDDFRLILNMLGWPVPTAALAAQTVYADEATGPAETVVKGFIARNALRLVRPVTVLASHGYGAAISAPLRMDTLGDVLLPLVAAAGIGLTVQQIGGQLVVDAYQTRDFPFPVSERSGVVQSWEWSRTAAASTRVVVGGQGVGVLRQFVQVVDVALEQLYGDKIEVFLDATDVGTIDSDTKDIADAVLDEQQAITLRSQTAATAAAALAALNNAQGILDADPANESAISRRDDCASANTDAIAAKAEAAAALVTATAARVAAQAAFAAAKVADAIVLTQRGLDRLVVDAPKVGLKVELSETEHFRYGDNLRVGDRLTINLGATTVTEVMSEATMNWDRASGFTTVPVVGDVTDDPTVSLLRVVAALAKTVRKLSSTR